MDKRLLWFVTFSVLGLWSIIFVTNYQANFGLAQAIDDNSAVLYYTEGNITYSMSNVLEWYNFTTVKVIFLDNESMLAKKIVLNNRLPVKRESWEISRIVRDDKDLIKSYPVVADRYVSRGGGIVVLTSGGY